MYTELLVQYNRLLGSSLPMKLSFKQFYTGKVVLYRRQNGCVDKVVYVGLIIVVRNGMIFITSQLSASRITAK